MKRVASIVPRLYQRDCSTGSDALNQVGDHLRRRVEALDQHLLSWLQLRGVVNEHVSELIDPWIQHPSILPIN